jgi:cysteine synthase A
MVKLFLQGLSSFSAVIIRVLYGRNKFSFLCEITHMAVDSGLTMRTMTVMGHGEPVTPMIMNSPGTFLKCEFLHPGRSHKARVARSLVDDAEARGCIAPTASRVLLERTGGNLGVGLAIEAKVRGYSLTLVTDPGYSAAKKSLARRFGATVLDRDVTFPGCRDNGEAITEILTGSGDRYHYLDQFGNPANPRTHELSTGPEIAAQLKSYGVGKESTIVLVCGLGTGATMGGVSVALEKRFARVHKVGVQPSGCDLKAGIYNDHPFQGIAVGQPPPFFDTGQLDDVIPVTQEQAADAHEYLLARHRFDVGPSSLANVAALRCLKASSGRRAGQVYVTLLFDRGEDYAL